MNSNDTDLNLFKKIFIAYCFVLFAMAASCSKQEKTSMYEDRPGINVEGETLEEACDIALQRISECLYEIPQQDPALVYIVDWEKKCNEQTVLRWQWMPCDEIREEAGR